MPSTARKGRRLVNWRLRFSSENGNIGHERATNYRRTVLVHLQNNVVGGRVLIGQKRRNTTCACCGQRARSTDAHDAQGQAMYRMQ